MALRSNVSPVVFVAVPMRDKIYGETWQSIRDLNLPRPYHLSDPRGYEVEIARNMLVKAALAVGMSDGERPVTHVLFIDDDMTFAPDAALRLLDHDLPIVGGLCYNRRHPYMPILLMNWPKDLGLSGYGYWYEWKKTIDARPVDEPNRSLLEVDYTGAAFLLVKREVFEKLPNPFTNTGGGEDVSFCRAARAAGYSVFVDTSVKIGHLGTVVVDEEFAERNRKIQFQPWTPTTGVTMGGLRILGDEDTPDGIMHRARYRWASDQFSEKFGPEWADVKVLDYGCGTGHGTELLCTAGFDAVGYDPDEAAILYGRDHFVLGNKLTTTPVEPGVHFDAVVAFEVLEHLDDAPATTLAWLLERAPIVIGSMPYLEPAGANHWHKHSMLDALSLGTNMASLTVFGQRWDGEIGPLEDRATTPIMLFIARRS